MFAVTRAMPRASHFCGAVTAQVTSALYYCGSGMMQIIFSQKSVDTQTQMCYSIATTKERLIVSIHRYKVRV